MSESNRIRNSRILEITTPSRLHFGLIDLNGEYGRIDGGTGVSLDNPCWVLRFETNDHFSFDPNDKISPGSLKEYDIEQVFATFTDLPVKCSIKVISAIPPHVGLGSHTQLKMAVVKGITALNDIEMDDDEIISHAGRGGTSGIGVRAFLNGGFVCDLGHSFGTNGEKEEFAPSSASKDVKAPPVLLNTKIPEEWVFIVTIPGIKEGASGSREISIFKEFCPISGSDVGEVSRIVLMSILPGILQNDIVSFGRGLELLQGTGFKKIEIDLQEPVIKSLFSLLTKEGAIGTGMSSFGPAVYALVDNSTDAMRIKEKIIRFLEDKGGGDVYISHGCNHGAITRIIQE
ncbi:MAG: beta-ribofuranosylaminobenzene 5'-phosphate synthase family protein [Candidatus Hodarchaeales archaeon]